MNKSNAKKQVAILVTNDLMTDRRINRVASFLKNNNFEVTLIGRQLEKTYPEKQYKEIIIKRFRLLFNKGPLFYFCYNLRAWLHLLRNRYDVVVSNDLDTLPAAYFSKRKTQRLVYDSHELFTEVPELIHRKHTQAIWTRIEQAILPKLKYCYTVSQPIADYYKKKYGVSFQVIRNLPRIATYKNTSSNGKLKKIANGKKIILYQGALNIGRGIEQIIGAMPLLKDNFIFTILGGGDIEATLKEQVRQFNLTESVFFLGRIPADDLPAYTVQADIGISLEQKGFGLSYEYALPNKLFDYIHAQIPVLVSSLPEMKKIVEQYEVGRVIDDHSPENIAMTIREMISEEKQIVWKQNEKEATTQLNWEKEQEKLYSFYS
jgi:glycosyltransferase involved in cell wall biosynthesis